MKLNYFVVGTNDMSVAVSFYDELFEESELTKIHAEGRMTFWQGPEFMFAVAEPYDGNAASVGNGIMLGFQLDDAEQVSRMHSKTLELGGADEGEPKERSGHFSAYARDLDGNKICFYAREG
jgi:hypothetical protein